MAETVEKILSATADMAKEAIREERVTFKDEFNKVRDTVLGKLPSPEEFFKLVERMKDMTDEEKEKLKQNLAERAMNAGKFKKVMEAQDKMETTYQHYLFFIGMVLLVVLVVVESPFNNARTASALEQLMKTPEGRELADQIRSKLKDLNEQFKGLSGVDKKQLVDEFKTKFADTLGNLKANLKNNAEDDIGGTFKFRLETDESENVVHSILPPNSRPFLLALLIIIALFGFFGYKLYQSIMDKEMRRENRGKGKQSRKKDKAATTSAPNSPKSEPQSSPKSPQKKKDL
ncbi:unnamed protein product [Diamesa tonsa]